jgi:hypothetical protein
LRQAGGTMLLNNVVVGEHENPCRARAFASAC